MYPYNFSPTLKGLNPEEVFVVMPFATAYDKVYTDLIEPAVREAGKVLNRPLHAYRTKGELRTTSGWMDVMEHLNTAQVVLSVLTNEVNANVHYEMGIAHATQPIIRQVLIAEERYKPTFDTKDLIFMNYSASSFAIHVVELRDRIRTSIEGWNVEQEQQVRHAIAKISPFEFEVVMLLGSSSPFVIATSGTGPSDYESLMARARPGDTRFQQDVFMRHCNAIGRLQEIGLLALDANAGQRGTVGFSYHWTDLGNLVLLNLKLITETDRLSRYQAMPPYLRRVT
jgi:hypothetical protein